MSVIDWFKKEAKIVESDVLTSISKIKAGVELSAKEIEAGFAYINGHSNDIARAVETVASIVGMLVAAGVGVPPGVLVAVREANVAVVGLNALVASQNAGSNNAEALVQGYVALKSAYNASNTATIAIAQTPGVKS